MSEIRLEFGDLAFMRELPRLLRRHVREAAHQVLLIENKRITRLQSQGLIRCVIDAEHCVGGFILTELSLTDAGRSLLAADAKMPGA